MGIEIAALLTATLLALLAYRVAVPYGNPGFAVPLATFPLVAALSLVGCATPTTVRKTVEPAAAAQETATQRKPMERQIKDFAHLQAVGRPLLRALSNSAADTSLRR